MSKDEKILFYGCLLLKAACLLVPAIHYGWSVGTTISIGAVWFILSFIRGC